MFNVEIATSRLSAWFWSDLASAFSDLTPIYDARWDILWLVVLAAVLFESMPMFASRFKKRKG